jgi:peptidoglycan/LPS O-acetylase OafA/YrhL
MNKHRIELLDSFRFIAVLCVLLYHLTDTWTSLYPYGNFFRHVFSFGYVGVQFFFMISGFVISYTLENTPNLLSFYRNRFARLFPPMLLCTFLTFITVCFLDDHLLFRNAHELKNFVPSLTFINPTLWTLITNVDFHWVNGSYWSLWVEIQFYFISSMLYFLSKRHFFRNILLAGIAISVIKDVPINLLNNHLDYLQSHGLYTFFKGWRYGNELFNITFYITWFMPGVIFYQLYKGFKLSQNIFPVICSVIALYCLVSDTRAFFASSYSVMMIACILMFALFLLMIYQQKYLSFLENALLTRIGVISYSIYLIHEDIGVLLINKYGKYLGNWSPLSPFIIMVAVICFAELSYRFYERRVALILRKIFNKPIKMPG